jgi:hypothetical protein
VGPARVACCGWPLIPIESDGGASDRWCGAIVDGDLTIAADQSTELRGDERDIGSGEALGGRLPCNWMHGSSIEKSIDQR